MQKKKKCKNVSNKKITILFANTISNLIYQINAYYSYSVGDTFGLSVACISLLVSIQKWHCKIHSPESSHRGSSASNEMHRWCVTCSVTEPKWLQKALCAAFFHATLQLLWIQFKCKITKKLSSCLLYMYSSCSWAWRGFGPSPGPTDHPDRSIGSDWLLHPLGVDLMRMDHPFFSPPISFQHPSAYFQS